MILHRTLIEIVGKSHVITDAKKAKAHTTGYRFGGGNVSAVVFPGNLLEFWHVLQVCVKASAIIICQAANTGLTGGSTPYGNDYDRPIVLINTLRLTGIFPINHAQEVVCLAGATLNDLEDTLRPLDREPHSVIGSSCIGASVVGGICNNSGGALVQRGPAYTEMALFAQLHADGTLQLHNQLGIALGDTPETLLQNLQNGSFSDSDISRTNQKGSDTNYSKHVRQIDSDTPARFNADPTRLFAASGSAGKLAIFAVRLDTFALAKQTAVFYIGTNNTKTLTHLRRNLLSAPGDLPISCEYIHRNAFAIASIYGKDTFWVIKHFGTKNLPKLFALKAKIDRLAQSLGLTHVSDKCLQWLSYLLPQHLPKKLLHYHALYDHHLILKIHAHALTQTHTLLQNCLNSDSHTADGAYFQCNDNESQAAMLHRFAVASAAVRYRAIHSDKVEDIVALDIALRRNDTEWFEHLPDNLNTQISHALYYGHFLCHVFHQDYIVKKGNDCTALEQALLQRLDLRGAKYPAEHNVGHLYTAESTLHNFYQSLDPCNCFNPGIGQLSKKTHWQ